MNFFTFTKLRRSVALSAAAAAVIMAVTLSCSKKCGDKVYDDKTQFCCNNRDIVDKCGGGEYDPETHFCHENSVVERCGGQEYDLASQFCYNNSIVADKCDGNEYDAEAKFCFRDKLLDKCGSSKYDPETQFCDSRDKNVYTFVKIQKQTWMAQNLNYKSERSSCYDDIDSNCVRYGRLYDGHMDVQVCPSGWHLSTRKEWTALEAAAGGSSAGKKLKSSSGWDKNGNGTDEFGFSALPSGYFDGGDPEEGTAGKFSSIGNFTMWWVAKAAYDDGPYGRTLNADKQNLGEFKGWPEAAEMKAAVRCVQN